MIIETRGYYMDTQRATKHTHNITYTTTARGVKYTPRDRQTDRPTISTHAQPKQKTKSRKR